MNESTLTQLKIIVERVVRPVRASTYRKRKMREELLAHVSGVFEEEAKLGDERAALERTALRFGNPGEVTSQLQESVPASDGIRRYCECSPAESVLRGALRFAWIEIVVCLVVLGVALVFAGIQSEWSREELSAVVSGLGFLPMWLLVIALFFLGTACIAHWMQNALRGSVPIPGWPRIGFRKLCSSAWDIRAVRASVIVGSVCLVLALWISNANQPMMPADWPLLTRIVAGVLFTGLCAAWAVVCAWFLVQSVDERRRYHAEWANLSINLFE